MSPSGTSQHKAEGTSATRNVAAELVPSFMTQKRDGESTKAAPREAQHAAHMENPRKGVGRGGNDEDMPEPVCAGRRDATIMLWRGPEMQGHGNTGWVWDAGGQSSTAGQGRQTDLKHFAGKSINRSQKG